ncbi:hypothetical protein QWZ13_09675 [Reinekea marina]|nr:hypothetical protein [Reinekea marina]MDN3649179.1 hypothetical protein [Reinekea marina]
MNGYVGSLFGEFSAEGVINAQFSDGMLSPRGNKTFFVKRVK